MMHYTIYIKRNRIANVKAPPHPPLPPAEAGRKGGSEGGEEHAAWKKLHGNFEKKTRNELSLLLLVFWGS